MVLAGKRARSVGGNGHPTEVPFLIKLVVVVLLAACASFVHHALLASRRSASSAESWSAQPTAAPPQRPTWQPTREPPAPTVVTSAPAAATNAPATVEENPVLDGMKAAAADATERKANPTAERIRRRMNRYEKEMQRREAAAAGRGGDVSRGGTGLGYSRPAPLHLPPPGKAKARFAYGILTHQANHDKRLAVVMSTWGRHANVAVIASDEADSRFPAIEAMPQYRSKRKLSPKTLHLWRSLCKHDADFYVMADDDSFLVVPNIEASVGSLDPQADMYTGYVLDHLRGWPLVGGGGGIVLSNYTMRSLCDYANQPGDGENVCRASMWPAGDTATMHCLRKIGVPPTHTQGFYPFPPAEMVTAPPNWCSITWWINPRYISCPPADRLMGVHYLGKDRAREYYYWTHLDAAILRI